MTCGVGRVVHLGHLLHLGRVMSARSIRSIRRPGRGAVGPNRGERRRWIARGECGFGGEPVRVVGKPSIIVDLGERGRHGGAIACGELDLRERDRAGVVVDHGDPLGDRARLRDAPEAAIEPRDHGECIGVAAIVVEQGQEVDRGGSIVGLA